MTDTPNPEEFSFIDKPNEFKVTLRAEGKIHMTINAGNADQARVKAEQIADVIAEGAEFAELDEILDIEIWEIRSTPRMYRVTDENGRDTQVSRLRPGMTPREPHDNGF